MGRREPQQGERGVCGASERLPGSLRSGAGAGWVWGCPGRCWTPRSGCGRGYHGELPGSMASPGLSRAFPVFPPCLSFPGVSRGAFILPGTGTASPRTTAAAGPVRAKSSRDPHGPRSSSCLSHPDRAHTRCSGTELKPFWCKDFVLDPSDCRRGEERGEVAGGSIKPVRVQS